MLLLDREDQVESTQLLQRLASLAAHRALMTVTPGGRALHWLAWDLLTGLGKRRLLRGSGRNAQEAWTWAHLWLRAEGVRELFVLRAHLLERPQLERLVEIGEACGLRVWLIFQAAALQRGQRDFAEAWGLAARELGDFEAEWAAETERSHSLREHSGGAEFPEVPRDDFSLFLRACRELLTPAESKLVEHVFRVAHDEARQQLSEGAKPEVAFRIARRLTEEASGLSEALTAVRAVQLAALRSRMLVRLDLPRFASGWSAVERALAPGEAAERLRWLAAPRMSAAAALASTGSFAPSQLAGLRVGDVARDQVTAGGEKVSVPEPLRPMIEVQRLQRRFDGADASDPFFMMDPSEGDLPWSARGVQTALRNVSRETGLLFPGSALTSRHAGDALWARQAGLKVVSLR